MKNNDYNGQFKSHKVTTKFIHHTPQIKSTNAYINLIKRFNFFLYSNSFVYFIAIIKNKQAK